MLQQLVSGVEGLDPEVVSRIRPVAITESGLCLGESVPPPVSAVPGSVFHSPNICHLCHSWS